MPTTDRRARRLAIARRRQRIAAQPRVGDVLVYPLSWQWTVDRVLDDSTVVARNPAGYPIRLSVDEWREAVRRAQVTQEGQIWRSV